MGKSTKTIIIADEVVMNKIYYICKQKIMLDRDLAELYSVQATRLREQVKRNIERFPKRFMFQLTTKEIDMSTSKNYVFYLRKS